MTSSLFLTACGSNETKELLKHRIDWLTMASVVSPLILDILPKLTCMKWS